jgi:hypothetical protein
LHHSGGTQLSGKVFSRSVGEELSQELEGDTDRSRPELEGDTDKSDTGRQLK